MGVNAWGSLRAESWWWYRAQDAQKAKKDAEKARKAEEKAKKDEEKAQEKARKTRAKSPKSTLQNAATPPKAKQPGLSRIQQLAYDRAIAAEQSR